MAQNMLFRWRLALLVLCASLAPGLLQCGKNREAESVPQKTPTLRIYALGTLAGAMEPCGCVKSMLGGVDHAADLLRKKQGEVESELLLAAGPLFFLNPSLSEKSRTQDLWKGEVVAKALGAMKLRAWAPGLNDWAAGPEVFKKYTELSGAKALAANLTGVTPLWVTEVGKTRVGVVGISLPLQNGIGPAGVQVGDATRALTQALQSLNAKGAQIRIALLSMPRGDALRLAEKVEGFQLMLVGKPYDEGELNDAPAPAVLVGKTLVIAPQNHLQSIASVDLYVRGDSYDFVDASGLNLREAFEVEKQRIHDLEMREPKSPALSQRRQALTKLEAQVRLYRAPVPPASGSFFFYQTYDVGEAAGQHPGVKSEIDGYYRRVNTYNREAFKDRLPMPVSGNQSHYVGVAACASCHKEEYAFWKTTQHASAYETLSVQSKEFNLDCVGCHVTGYEKPGGSTVTHVEPLKNVQCEVCHGPGSKHAETGSPQFIQSAPSANLCGPMCHHPPHVGREWTVEQAWPHIIGPGHGL